MALALLIGGIVMWAIDVWSDRRYESSTLHVEQMTRPGHLDRPLPDPLGHLPRHLALHVHHRRGQLAGLDRPTALEFSFLLSIPTMIAATAWDFIKEFTPAKPPSPRPPPTSS
jgi:undecaprenyl-diphosphatase